MLIKFFKKNFLLSFLVILISLIFLKNKILNLININNYDHSHFWKFTNLLNNLKFNLMIILTLIVLIKINKNFFKKMWFIFILSLVFYLIFFWAPIYINLLKVDFNFFSKKINIALLNGILNVHPWLTYLVYSLIIFFFINLKNFKKKYIYTHLNIKNNIKHLIILLITSSIFLGAYWAFQELSWGGWWNWDVVELISLLFFFYVTLLLHNNVINIFFKKINFLKILIIFLISFIVVRFNLLTSIHTFINTTQNVIFLFNYSFIILFFTILIIFFKKIWMIENQFLKKKTYFFFFNIYIINILIYITFFLLNIFFKKNFFLEFNVYFEFFFLLYLSYLMLNFLVSNSISIKNVYFNFFINNYIIFISQIIKFSFKFRNNFIKLHLLIIIIFLIIFFFKIYFIHKSIFLEINFFKKNNILMCCISNNNFKIINYKIYENFVIYENIFVNLKFNNLNFELKTHVYKNLIYYFYSFFIKIINPNNNSTIFIYSNLFLILIFIKIPLMWFKLKNQIKIS